MHFLTTDNNSLELTMLISEQLRVNALNWCKKFLGGSWLKCDRETFKITNLLGALTNYIYLCEIGSSIPIEEHEHRIVLLRVYGEISGPHEKFYELVIFNLLSERKIGPRMLGAFKSGRLEEYIESIPMTVHEMRSGQFLPQIAQKMAKYHCMEVPFSKYPNYIPRFLKRYIKYFEKVAAKRICLSEQHSKILDEVIKMDPVKEYYELQKLLEEGGSVVVFCHNDVQEGNLLIQTTKEDNSAKDIMLIDYEYSYYGRRGYDIGNHFCEWVLQNIADTPEGFSYDPKFYPTEEQQMLFAKEYLKYMSEELIDAPESRRRQYLVTPEELIREANEHSLMSNLYWGFWGFAQHELSKIEWDFLAYSLCRFKLYFHFKEKFYPKPKQ